MNTLPKISIVTATYRSTAFIDRLRNSLRAQEFRDFEWICVDDCSPDETVAHLLACENPAAHPMRVYRLPTNTGGTGALAVGIERARGEIIVCVDHDDELLPDSLSRMARDWALVADEDRLAGLFYRVVESDSGQVFGANLPDGLTFTMNWLSNFHPEFSDGTAAIKAGLLKHHARFERFNPVNLWGVPLNALTQDRKWILAPGGPVRIYHRDNADSQTRRVRISAKTVNTYAALLNQFDRTCLIALPYWFRHAVSLLRFSRAVHGSERTGIKLLERWWMGLLLIPLIPLARWIALHRVQPEIVAYAALDAEAVRHLPDLREVPTI